VLGKRVRVDDGARAFDAEAVDLADDGALVVRRNGALERVLAGDVSVRVA
jgi:biotin-(acetyl-CoA carboxylase) ligase